jgi:hypothetical protein
MEGQMTFRFCCLVIVLAAVFASSAARAQTPPSTLNVPNTSTAPPSGSPVEVEDCKLHYQGGLMLAKTGKLVIEFTNEGSVTADMVRFRIGWGTNDAAFIRDQGKFSPGVTVKHEFKQSEGALISPLFSHPNLQCSVESVHFMDGSIWTAQEEPAASAAIPAIVQSVSSPTPGTEVQSYGSGYVGAEFEQMDPNVIRVRLVIPGGPADQGGMKQGDIINSIDGERLASLQDLIELITASPSGIILRFSVDRNGEAMNLRIKVRVHPQ